MAYDEALAWRIREAVAGVLADTEQVTEKAMFGGLAFLLAGHMSVAASGQGGLMVRVDPAETDSLVDPPDVDRVVMRGRAMDGWLRVAEDAVDDDAELHRWVTIGIRYARTLPPT